MNTMNTPSRKVAINEPLSCYGGAGDPGTHCFEPRDPLMAETHDKVTSYRIMLFGSFEDPLELILLEKMVPFCVLNGHTWEYCIKQPRESSFVTNKLNNF